ncbi:serine protease [Acidimicrobiia bacterium EGI L10123]|uniref:serine protease n=1 Tax=Salinilacustrithrix flava TaxID=2957203 RepID=UPI003D7C1BC1|nr:serine protease [Acidimicrobiia bacterium EGI L10123]
MRSFRRRPVTALATLALAATGLALTGAPGAQAQTTWASPADATITPGVQMFTEGAQCTANFIFEDAATGSAFIGYAAHCAGAGGDATDTDGCVAPSLAPGHPVEIAGADHPGELAYSSWHTMQAIGEQDPVTCLYNDFALVEIHPDDVAKVNPSVPHWGGPTSLGTDGPAAGTTVHSYGNSSLRFGITQLSPKTGLSLGTAGSGWTHQTYTLTPGIPGDSGSGLLDADGRAVGVLSTLALAPLAGSNNYSDLGSALDYLRAHTGRDIALVEGDVDFDGAQLPLGLGL